MSQFSEGTAAMYDGDWERACRLFREASDLEPDNLMFRQTLRGCAAKLSERRRVTLFDHAVHFSKVRQALANEDWQLADRLAEDGLLYLPGDADLNAALGRACYHLGYQHVAAYACQCAICAELDHAEGVLLAVELQTAFVKPLINKLLQLWRQIFADGTSPKEPKAIDEQATVSHLQLGIGESVRHATADVQFIIVPKGLMRFELGESEGLGFQVVDVGSREILCMPLNVQCTATAIEESVLIEVSTPPNNVAGRQDA